MTLLISFIIVTVELIRCVIRRVWPSMRLLLLLLVLSTATLVTEWLSPVLLSGSDNLQRHLSRAKAPAVVGRTPETVTSYYAAPIESLALKSVYDVRNDHIAEVYLTFGVFPPQQNWLNRRFYLRTLAFDAFDKDLWTRRRTPDHRLDAPDRGEPIILTPASTNAFSYTMRVRSHRVLQLPYVSVLNSISLPSLIKHPDGVISACDIPESPFLVYSAVSSPVFAGLPEPGSLSAGDTPGPEYLRLSDAALTERIRDLSRTIAGEVNDPAIVLRRLIDYLQTTCTYSLRTENPDARDPIENFLFHEQSGHCELFATSFALLLRASGIPSRLVTGYCGGEYNAVRDTLVFFSDDAHAWVEVFAGERGWIIVDPTPSAAGAPTPPTMANGADTMLANVAAKPQGRVLSLLRHLVTPPLPSRVGAVGLCIMLVVLVVATLRNQRATRRTFLSPYSAPPTFLRTFLHHAASHGHAIRRGQTLRDYVNSLKSAGHIGNEYDPLVDYVYAISYGGKSRSRSLEKQFIVQIRHTK